jgi:hypothetical protein
MRPTSVEISADQVLMFHVVACLELADPYRVRLSALVTGSDADDFISDAEESSVHDITECIARYTVTRGC